MGSVREVRALVQNPERCLFPFSFNSSHYEPPELFRLLFLRSHTKSNSMQSDRLDRRERRTAELDSRIKTIEVLARGEEERVVLTRWAREMERKFMSGGELISELLYGEGWIELISRVAELEKSVRDGTRFVGQFPLRFPRVTDALITRRR